MSESDDAIPHLLTILRDVRTHRSRQRGGERSLRMSDVRC
jgi:hypothetical protein